MGLEAIVPVWREFISDVASRRPLISHKRCNKKRVNAPIARKGGNVFLISAHVQPSDCSGI